MDITKEFLKEKGACGEGYEWFVNQKETDGMMDYINFGRFDK